MAFPSIMIHDELVICDDESDLKGLLGEALAYFAAAAELRSRHQSRRVFMDMRQRFRVGDAVKSGHELETDGIIC